MFILVPELGPRVVVRDGFASGYLGEGPRGLVEAILLLDSKRWDISELRISEALFETIAESRMTEEQLTKILDARREPVSEVLVRYVSREALEASEHRSPWDGRPVILPFAIIDRRILDLAYAFFDDPDTVLHRGYRRLEDTVRERSGLNDHGARLFSRAFGVDQSPLVWDMHGEDSIVFAQLFVSAFSGFRNARAHRELEGSSEDLAVEFLQLNTLYLLESRLVKRDMQSGESESVGA